MTTLELIEKGIGYNCLSDAYDLGRADAIDEMVNVLGTEPFSAYVMDIIRHWAEQLKEQK